MRNVTHHSALSILAMLMTTAAASPALGQAAKADRRAAPAGEPQVEEIIVTANKRAQSINRVGMSITAVSGDTLIRSGVTSPQDLAKVVPGFHFSPSLYGSPIYTMRGIGFNSTALGASPAVSVYVDEVPLPFPSMTLGATLDVERVEALKGPQGVLFGNNSTGGAINFIAASPTSTFHAGGLLSYASFDSVQADGYVSAPLSPGLTARISLRTEQGGAWQQSQTRPGDTLGSARRGFGRIILDFKPDSKLSLRLNVNGWIDKSDTQARRAIGIYPLIPGTIVGLPVNAFVPAGLIAAFPPPASDARAADWDPGRRFRNDSSFFQVSLRANYMVSDAVRLTSITAYSSLRPDAVYDSDGTAFPSLIIAQRGRIRSFFQELRADTQLSDRAALLIGANYEHSNIRDSAASSGNLSSFNFFFGNPSSASDTRANTRAKTYAIFGKLDFKLSDTVKLIGAARYTKDSRTSDLCTYDVNGAVAALQNIFSGTHLQQGDCITSTNGIPGVTHKSLSEHNLSWRLGLEWQAAHDTLLYATANRGFKAGGFPNVFAFNSSQFTPVVQEEVNAYEVGAKVGMFDRRLQLNGALFRYDYKNKQIQGRVIVPGLGPLENQVNVPKSRVNGAEFQLTAVPVTGLSIQAGATYVDTKLGAGTFATTPFGGYPDVSGQHFPDTPAWQANADVSYEHPVSNSVKAFVGTSLVYTGALNTAFGDLPILHVPGYTLVDARIGIAALDDGWRVTLFARNLTDNVYYYSTQQTIDVLTRFYGQPRAVGVTIQGKF